MIIKLNNSGLDKRLNFSTTYRVIYLVLLMALMQPAFASNTDSIPQFDNQRIEAYKSQQAFNYKQAPIPNNADSFFKRIIDNFLSATLSDDSAINLILYTILFISIVFVIMTFMNVKVTSLFSSSSGKMNPSLDFNVLEDNLHETNFDELITKALTKQQYRLATRLYYLKTLQLLSNYHLIQWKKDKTNHDYTLELQSTMYHSDFTKITESFNYVWYGNFTITQQAFVGIEQLFKQMEQRIKQPKSSGTA